VRALSLYLARSPVCEQLANERDRKRNARKFSLLNTEIVVQSSKRPTPLRRNVVNNIRHIVQHDCKNEVLQDLSDFNFPNMYGDKMDAYEADLSAHDDPSDGSLPEEDHVSVLSQDTDKFGFVPPPHNHPLMFTSNQKWTIALLKLLDNMNAPDYAFEAIIKWARADRDDNYTFLPEDGFALQKCRYFVSVNEQCKAAPSVCSTRAYPQ
jgi:hypothetical protein